MAFSAQKQAILCLWKVCSS